MAGFERVGDCMTVNDLVAAITSLRGQQYGTDMLMGWINEIEGQVIEEVINQAEGYDRIFTPLVYEEDQDRILSVPERFQDVYINYLLSKIDYFNEETERYNNDVTMYNAAYDSFAAWFRRMNPAKKTALFTRF